VGIKEVHGCRPSWYASRRVWIRGQRLHHGATGALFATLGLLLMAHDWKDRARWFARGWQES
jgi:hypothetical protein